LEAEAIIRENPDYWRIFLSNEYVKTEELKKELKRCPILSLKLKRLRNKPKFS
jgi:hypothetical protein